jgi:hypothetical protein
MRITIEEVKEKGLRKFDRGEFGPYSSYIPPFWTAETKDDGWDYITYWTDRPSKNK